MASPIRMTSLDRPALANILLFSDKKTAHDLAFTNSKIYDVYKKVQEQNVIDNHPILKMLNSSSFIEKYNRVHLQQYLLYATAIDNILDAEREEEDDFQCLQNEVKRLLTVSFTPLMRSKYCPIKLCLRFAEELMDDTSSILLASIIRKDEELFKNFKFDTLRSGDSLAVAALFSILLQSPGFFEKLLPYMTPSQITPQMMALTLRFLIENDWKGAEMLVLSSPIVLEKALEYYADNPEILDKIQIFQSSLTN